MRTIIWFIYFWIYLIGLWPKMKKVDRLLSADEYPAAKVIVEREVRQWAKSLLHLAGVKVEVEGLEHIPNETVLFVSNHQGNFDIPILLAWLDKPRSLVAKIELKKMPLIRTWMRYLECTFIDRHDARQSLKALNESEALLKAGKSVIIFPEGTRSKGDIPGEFKSGAFKMAMKTGVPIVPVSIDGSYRVMEEHGFWIHPATVKLTVLPPVATSEMTKEDLKTIGDDVKKMILNARTANTVPGTESV